MPDGGSGARAPWGLLRGGDLLVNTAGAAFRVAGAELLATDPSSPGPRTPALQEAQVAGSLSVRANRLFPQRIRESGRPGFCLHATRQIESGLGAAMAPDLQP